MSQVEIKVNESSIRVMTPEVFNKNGSIAVTDIHLVIDGTVIWVAKNVWLKKVDFKGVKKLELSAPSYPSSSNKINPKTNKPYNDVPFTFFPKLTKTGTYGSYSDSNNTTYQALCKSIYDKAVAKGFVETAGSPTPPATGGTKVYF